MHDAPTTIMVDASDTAVGAVLQQQQGDTLVPLCFFSKKLQPAETRYSTFDRELLAAYLAVKHFRYFIEGRQFTLLTDHKPIVHALQTPSANSTPRQTRHLSLILEYTGDVRHVSGVDNPAADALSRTIHAADSLSRPIDVAGTSPIDYARLAAAQSSMTPPDPDSLHLKWLRLPNHSVSLLCDTSTGTPRPLLPPAFRRQAFDALHSLAHPGTRASRKLVASRFVWPAMNKDVAEWARQCLQCQRNKVNRHTHSAPGSFPLPEARFLQVHVDLVGPLPNSHGYTCVLTAVDRFFQVAGGYARPQHNGFHCGRGICLHVGVEVRGSSFYYI